MPTSASCPRSDVRPAARPAAGFTLLELLIVLALIAMAAAVVAPRLQRTYDAIAGSGERAEVVRQLQRLPLLARDAGAAIEIPVQGGAARLAGLLALPEGWSVSPLSPLRVEASGVCHAARLRVRGRDVAEIWTLSPPDCGVGDAP